jgi:hypothetical protein
MKIPTSFFAKMKELFLKLMHGNVKAPEQSKQFLN